ncbi:MAG: hypothetical protein WDN23_01705 [Edaphobacter sp.]
MGREATCQCSFITGDGSSLPDITGEVKVLLESDEMVLYGNIRMRVPLRAVENVRVESEVLSFNLDKHLIELHLGAKAAESWAKKIKSPPPTLADKLGITGKVVRTIGPIADRALDSALTSAAQIRAEDPDLILACIDTPDSLATTLRAAKSQLARHIPIWLVYRKGPGHPLNESGLRATLRAAGLMDTKVASVSEHLTALRFNRPKST